MLMRLRMKIYELSNQWTEEYKKLNEYRLKLSE